MILMRKTDDCTAAILRQHWLTWSVWDWLLPWRARAWQKRAAAVIAELTAEQYRAECYRKREQ